MAWPPCLYIEFSHRPSTCDDAASPAYLREFMLSLVTFTLSAPAAEKVSSLEPAGKTHAFQPGNHTLSLKDIAAAKEWQVHATAWLPLSLWEARRTPAHLRGCLVPTRPHRTPSRRASPFARPSAPTASAAVLPTTWPPSTPAPTLPTRAARGVPPTSARGKRSARTNHGSSNRGLR